MSGTLEFVDRYLKETAEVAARTSRGDLTRAIEILHQAFLEGRHLYTCGNGGSAANASHLACDLAKFTHVPGKRRVKATSLCDNAALISALTNDAGFGHIFSDQLDPVFERGDVLICLSVHGGKGADRAGPWSQNLVAAAELARSRGGKVVSLVGYDGGALRTISDACVIVPSSEAGHTSTPHVEGFHEVYHHLICERLRQLVAESPA